MSVCSVCVGWIGPYALGRGRKAQLLAAVMMGPLTLVTVDDGYCGLTEARPPPPCTVTSVAKHSTPFLVVAV